MGIPAGISGIQEWLKFAHFCIHEIRLTKGRIFQVQLPGTFLVIASSWANFSQCMCKSFACFFDGQENQDTILTWKSKSWTEIFHVMRFKCERFSIYIIDSTFFFSFLILDYSLWKSKVQTTNVVYDRNCTLKLN